jgi:hypothetical protein
MQYTVQVVHLGAMLSPVLLGFLRRKDFVKSFFRSDENLPAALNKSRGTFCGGSEGIYVKTI